MPRSGKSYAALKDHIIPALTKGRTVYCRIDGLNFKQIGDLSGISEDDCQKLLIPLSEEQCAALPEQKFQQDALIVIDEAQNYWQSGRAKLAPELLKWIAEHGHHGHDVLLMGQLLKDVHTSWVNRVNRKVTFIKKDVVGKAGEYKWIMYHGAPDNKGNVKFREVSRGDHKYDDRYFGAYKSHSDGTTNKETYNDSRANVFKSPAFRKWIPIFGVCVIASIGFLFWAFKGGGLEKSFAPTAHAKKPATPVKTVQEVKTNQSQSVPSSAKAAPLKSGPDAPMPESADYIDDLNSKYRARLSGYARGDRKTIGLIEWVDGSSVKDRLRFSEIQGLGWIVLVSTDGGLAVVQKGSRRFVASAWPLEDTLGVVPAVQQQQIRGDAAQGGSGGVITAPPVSHAFGRPKAS